jgi:hypothetical protein
MLERQPIRVELTRRLVADQPHEPLAAARAFLQAYGDTAEGQALRRVIVTITTRQGRLSESDLWLFSQRTTGVATGRARR